jgi:hypothetical protein
MSLASPAGKRKRRDAGARQQPNRPAAGHGPAATEREHSHGVLITRTEPDRRIGACVNCADHGRVRTQIK